MVNEPLRLIRMTVDRVRRRDLENFLRALVSESGLCVPPDASLAPGPLSGRHITGSFVGLDSLGERETL